MALSDWINTDTYLIYRNKFNAVRAKVQGGALGQLLLGNGVNSDPVWSDQWTAWTQINTSNQNSWQFDSTRGLWYRKSKLDGKVQIKGQMNGVGNKQGVNEICVNNLPISIRPNELIYTTAATSLAQVAKIVITTVGEMIVITPSDLANPYYFNFVLFEYYTDVI